MILVVSLFKVHTELEEAVWQVERTHSWMTFPPPAAGAWEKKSDN